ncbi:MAG: peptide ABC transporter substrate-binding protein [Clostridia bacterium]|nr:peptide ABC transporter substrate-binding protein [Clostridia bacterium]
MKKLAKLMCALLVVALLAGVIASCGKTTPTEPSTTTAAPSESVAPTQASTGSDTPVEPTTKGRDVMKVTDNSVSDTTGGITVVPDYSDFENLEHEEGDENWAVYSAVLGDYYKELLAAKAEEDVSAKYTLMAIAEAKLLESAAFLPTSTQGGMFALTKVAPYTVSSALWGLDSDRMHNMVVTNETIKASDRDALKAKYAELKGTGTYEQYAKDYLTSHGYTLKDSYTTAFSSDPRTWDILNTYRAADAEAIVFTFDGLLEYDNEGRMLAGLATEYTVSEDGLTYTFKIREGVNWVTQDGAVYAEVTANDFVSGMKHLLDIKGGTEYLVEGIIKNASEYLDGDVTDFAEVGVKALDKYTLQYTLEKPVSYFITMFNYNPFAPANQEYMDAQGDDYGTDPSHILYCGPYIVTEFTSGNKIEYTLNENYWAKDSVNLKKVTWLYNDGSDATKGYIDFKQGARDGVSLSTTTYPMAVADGYTDYIYVSGTNATTYAGFVNLDRKNYETIEGFGMASTKTDAQKAESIAALKNLHFRSALLFSIDRTTYNAIQVGEDVALYSLRNTYTPGTYVTLERDVTVDINGTSTTFPAGTYYGEIIQAQLDADGSSIVAWDPTAEGGVGSSDGFDGWYNPEVAVSELNKAIEELAAEGVTVSAENPITIDYPYYSANPIYSARAAALKKNIEEVLGGKVVLNLVGTENIYGWYYAGYYCDSGDQTNYDLYDVSGWGPDYGDPATYLNTMLPDFGGDMTHVLGIY